MLRILDTPEYDIEQLRAQIDLRAIVTPGARISDDKPTKTKCFWHSENEASLNVYPSHMHCFGCQAHYSVFDYVAWQENLDPTAEFDKVLAIVAETFVGVLPPPPPPQPKKPLKPLESTMADYMHEKLGEHRRWFIDRGLNDDTIDRERLGYDRRAFVIPVWSETGELMTLRYRRDDEAFDSSDSGVTVNASPPDNKYWGMKNRNDAILYNPQALALIETFGYLLICEGELDALLLYQHGLPALSVTNGSGAFLRSFVNLILERYPKRVILVYDQDPAGQKNAAWIARLFGVRGRVSRWDLAYGKDPTEVFKYFRDVNPSADPVERFMGFLDAAGAPEVVERYWKRQVKNSIWSR